MRPLGLALGKARGTHFSHSPTDSDLTFSDQQRSIDSSPTNTKLPTHNDRLITPNSNRLTVTYTNQTPQCNQYKAIDSQRSTTTNPQQPSRSKATNPPRPTHHSDRPTKRPTQSNRHKRTNTKHPTHNDQ